MKSKKGSFGDYLLRDGLMEDQEGIMAFLCPSIWLKSWHIIGCFSKFLSEQTIGMKGVMNLVMRLVERGPKELDT